MLPTVLVNGRFLTRRTTGVERYAWEVTRRLNDRVKIVRAPFRQGLAGHIWEQTTLPKSLKEQDILLSLANTGPVRVTRQVVTIHDISVIEHPEWYRPGFAAWYRLMLPKLARNAALVLTDSAYSKIRMVELFRISPEKVEIVPCGVDLAVFSPRLTEERKSVRRKYNLPQEYLLFVGSNQPRKNLDNLFQAFKTISDRLKDIHLVLAGAGNQKNHSPGFNLLPERVHWLGYVDEPDLPAIYSAAKVFVLPSRYEGFGLPVLEAMACGTPVVASATTSLPEVVGEAGRLFDPDDSEQLAWTIVELLEDRAQTSKLAKSGIERAKDFSWDQTSRSVWQAVSRLL